MNPLPEADVTDHPNDVISNEEKSTKKVKEEDVWESSTNQPKHSSHLSEDSVQVRADGSDVSGNSASHMEHLSRDFRNAMYIVVTILSLLLVVVLVLFAFTWYHYR